MPQFLYFLPTKVINFKENIDSPITWEKTAYNG